MNAIAVNGSYAGNQSYSLAVNSAAFGTTGI
jgi:hypothetical protein